MSSLAWCFRVLTCLIVLQITSFISKVSASSKDDKIATLPGQPPVDFDQYAGYIQVEKKSLFYYFVEGPGCSSVGGAFNGHGPFIPKGQVLIKNQFSWNQEANMLFLESPAGVGFSYSSNMLFTNDEITAQDNLNFLFGWLEKFPEYKNKDFFITGVSYAGHFVPQLANLILESRLKSNLKGIAIGNPLLDFDTDYNSRADFLWSHGLISDSTFSMANSICNVSQIFKQFMQPQGNLSAACSQVYNQGIAEIGSLVNIENVLTDICQFPSQPHAGGNGLVYHVINKCAPQFISLCTMMVDGDIGYIEQDALVPTLPLVGKLVKGGVQVMVFSGDQDTEIPFIGTRILIKALAEELGLNTTVPYTSWLHNKQVGGWTQVYGEKLRFATVRGGGHYSTLVQPERTLALFNTFLQGKPLPVSPPPPT